MYQWQKWTLFARKCLTLCFGLLCEFFWTACILVCKCDKNGHFSPKNALPYVSVYSVNFFERHVSRYVSVTKTDTFRPKTPHFMIRFTLWIFLNGMYLAIEVWQKRTPFARKCLQFFWTPCILRNFCVYFFIPRLAPLARQAFGLPRSLRGSNNSFEKIVH